MRLPDLYRRRPPAATSPPDPLGVLFGRSIPQDIADADSRAAAQEEKQRQYLMRQLFGLRLLGMTADTVVGDVRRKVNATAATIPYERDEVDSIAKTTAIKANEILSRYGS